MSSKSSSPIMAGIIRSISGPGGGTRTEDSFPTSDVTRSVMGAPKGARFYQEECGGSGKAARDNRTHRSTDERKRKAGADRNSPDPSRGRRGSRHCRAGSRRQPLSSRSAALRRPAEAPRPGRKDPRQLRPKNRRK